MKKFIIASVVLILGLATEVSHAQSRITPDQAKQMKAHFQEFSSKLNLSDSQSVQVRAIDSAYLKGLSDLRNQSGSRLSKLREFKKLSATRSRLTHRRLLKLSKFTSGLRGGAIHHSIILPAS